MPLPSFRYPLVGPAPVSYYCRSVSMADFADAFADESAVIVVVLDDDACQ